MRLTTRSNRPRRGATIILLLSMVPLLLIPLIGLAIDGTRLYIVQSKLSAAVDGAALGSGRLLGTSANTTEIAGEFLNVNFPSGFWSTNNLQKNISYTNNLGVQTISIYATVNLPLTFARMLGQTGSLVSASAVATRRVTRVELVLDRSGSMNNTDPVTHANVFTTMQAGAEWFASQFTPGYDEMGLIVFSGGALVAYPETRPYNNDPTSAGGPDKNFATNAQTMTGPVFDQLTAMSVGGGTGTPEALALAYIELQKAHARDLAANGTDNTLNTIVLFTDGVPDSIAVYANDPNHNSLKPVGNAANQSKCTNNPATSTASTQMKGYLVSPGGPPGNGTSFPGWGGSGNLTAALIRLPAYDTSQNLTWWLGTNGANDLTPGPQTSVSGCMFMGNTTTDPTNNGTKYGCLSTYSSNPILRHDNCTTDDLAKVPDFDLYGYSTSGTNFTNSVMFDGTNTWQPNTGSYDASTPDLGYNIAAASWNLTDKIGKAIRTQNTMNQIQIFTIGYSGNSGTDTGLLNRLANTPQSTSYVSSEPNGKFYLVNSTSQLISAFDSVASSLLRLAQ
ncbi:MAG TPA: vWA domain-containing protein [Bryobacteraceae bacterium]|nr:vWA domain-containing protein [Bryobacteraceae bacterium]